MKPIKIYGESKTGTTYLEHLLKKNTDADILESSNWGPLGWKHGFPQAGDATYIFIFRNVYEWAKSLLADSIDKRFRGLEAKFGGTEYDHWNIWGNPIKCRTAKYYSYLGFSRINDSFLINYDWLRMNLDCISLFATIKWDEPEDILKHTYKNIQGRDNPDRRELTEQEKAFIDSQIDPKLESFVDKLAIQ